VKDAKFLVLCPDPNNIGTTIAEVCNDLDAASDVAQGLGEEVKIYEAKELVVVFEPAKLLIKRPKAPNAPKEDNETSEDGEPKAKRTAKRKDS
jgi:hypothetical protein